MRNKVQLGELTPGLGLGAQTRQKGERVGWAGLGWASMRLCD